MPKPFSTGHGWPVEKAAAGEKLRGEEILE
jgi:hypothetical protein